MTAFLLTWKESGWPHENIVRMMNAFSNQGYVDEPWRLAAHRMARPGDRVWALKQGRGPKGIFARGRITAVPARGETGAGKIQWMAPVRFEDFVDPKEQFLIGEEAVSRILRHAQIRAQGSGYPLDDDQSAELEKEAGKPPVDATGGDWNAQELQAIVADYFLMLQKELAGEAYSKTEHRRAVMELVHRSAGSIERKHQNISAVLMTLGLPWINGYKPLRNFQDALTAAVEAVLDVSLAELDDPAEPSSEQVDLTTVMVPPPQQSPGWVEPRPVRRLIRKYDPAARDAANRRLGKAGEQFVQRFEFERLTSLGRSDLAARVQWVAKAVGDGLGYDITSFNADGSPIFIEVKTTRGPIETPFFISPNELRVSAELGKAFRLYRAFSFGNRTRIYEVVGSLEERLQLEATCYRARVRPRFP